MNKLKYLGIQIESNTNQESEINFNVTKTMYHTMTKTFINKTEISCKTKLTVYNTTYRYEHLDVWPEHCQEQKKNKIHSAKMKYLTRLIINQKFLLSVSDLDTLGLEFASIHSYCRICPPSHRLVNWFEIFHVVWNAL